MSFGPERTLRAMLAGITYSQDLPGDRDLWEQLAEVLVNYFHNWTILLLKLVCEESVLLK